MNTPKKRIGIIGAGMAGLAAAYELSKDDRFDITIFEERDRVGGRVHTLEIEGQPVDFGGFIIYPWYHEYLRVMEELKIEHLLEPVPLSNIYYQVDDTGRYYTDDQIPFERKDLLRLVMSLARPVLLSNDIANPPLDYFNRQTASEFYRKVLNRPEHAGLFETYTDVVTQGYCYPGVDKFRLTFMAPFIRMPRLYGDVKDSYYIRSGNEQVPQAMAKAITQNGGRIALAESVTSADSLTVTTAKGRYKFDEIIFAQTVSSQLYNKAIPEVKEVIEYTQFYTVTIKADKIPVIEDSLEWAAAFYKPNTREVQVVSSINLAAVYDKYLQGYINLNVVIRSGSSTDIRTSDQLHTVLLPELKRIFPHVEIEHVVASVHWPQTMPIATEEFVEVVRSAQGKNGIYYAGDFLGAPSMETALTTGIRAAEAIREKYA